MGALYQYWLYTKCERRGASDAWVRSGKERALVQIKGALQDTIELIGAIICALIVSLAVYILTGRI